MFSKQLEITLNKLIQASGGGAMVSVEELLLSIFEDDTFITALIENQIDINNLRTKLIAISRNNTRASMPENQTSEVGDDFQRILQRAVFIVQSSSRNLVTGADILHAILLDNASDAARILAEQGLVSSGLPITSNAIAKEDIENELKSAISRLWYSLPESQRTQKYAQELILSIVDNFFNTLTDK